MTLAWLASICLAGTHLPYDMESQSTMLVLGEFAQSVTPGTNESWPTGDDGHRVNGRHWLAERPVPSFHLVNTVKRRGKEFAVYELSLRGKSRTVELVRP